MVNALLRYPGAKWRIAQKIVDNFPEHKVYLEPFFGSGAVFFTKELSYMETINDIDHNVINFFKVLRERPEELARLIELTPFSREEFMKIQEERAGAGIQISDDDVENARRFIVRCNQGFGSKLSDRVGWKNTCISAGPKNAEIWCKVPEIIIHAAKRLKHAQIECMPAVQLIEKYNAEDCLIYADPPYIKEARLKRMYLCEMQGEAEHLELVEKLKAHKGHFVLSGYDNEVYRKALQGYRKIEIKTYVNSGRNATECLWLNF